MDVLRRTGIKAFAVSLVCFLIYLLTSVHVPVAFGLFLLANTALFVGFFCSFDPAVPLRALVAIGFLAAAATVNLWAGAFALQNPLAAWLSFVLFGPAAALIADQPTEVVAVTMMIFSLIALMAAVAMTKRRKIGYWIWVAIIIVLFPCNLWVLGTQLLSVRGSPGQANSFGTFGWWLLLQPLLYAFAYWLSFAGVELK